MLTLNADGTYSYDGDPNVVPPRARPTSSYTLKDGDGDTSTTTLTHQPDGQRDRCADAAT